MIVVMAGLPGTGKSTVAKKLAKELGGVVLNKDVLRAGLFPDDFVEYSREQDDFVQELMQKAAEYLLTQHPELTVLFDGRTFSRAYQIDSVIETANRLGSAWRIVECVCPEEVAEKRIEGARRHPAKNRTVELYRKIRDEFEPVREPKLVVDTEGTLEESVAAIREYLGK